MKPVQILSVAFALLVSAMSLSCGNGASPSPSTPPDAALDAGDIGGGDRDASAHEGDESEVDGGVVPVDGEDGGDADAGSDDWDAGGDDVSLPWTDDELPLNDESGLTGVRAQFDPTLVVPSGKHGGTPDQFLAFPFPADHRRNSDGTVRWDDFPQPDSMAQTMADNLLDKYLSVIGGVDGFSLNGAVHVAFDGALDLSGVSERGDDFLKSGAPFMLVDIDQNSPEVGMVRPLRWEWQSAAGNYAAKNSLAVAPAWGFNLRETTTYALVILKTGLRGADQSPMRQPLLLSALLANRAQKPASLTWVSDDLYEQLRASYAPLRQILAEKKISIQDVAVATVFTTQNVTKELRKISSQLTADLKSGTWKPKATYVPTGLSYWGNTCWQAKSSDTWATCSYKWNSTDTATLYHLEASFNGRNYQEGQVPYLYEGGNFRFNYKGVPQSSEETLKLMVTIPKEPLSTKDGCIPIVEIAHGTGGDALSGLGDKTSLRLAGRGLASVGMDQPLHGDRFDVETYMKNLPSSGSLLGVILSLGVGGVIDSDTFLSLMNFNFLNINAARTCIRQSAVDTMALTHLIQSGGLDVPSEFSPTGKPITFCKDKIGFFGHSQGGLSGAVAAGLEHRIGGWLLSAAGGGLGITILDRKDFGEFPVLLGRLFGLSSGESLTELHPLMTMIQTMVDITDPINYARYWMQDDIYGAPTNQLCTSGVKDSQTPPRSARALALAGHLTPIKPLATDMSDFEWAGILPADSPVSGNNHRTTNAFIQVANDGNNVNNYKDERWAGHFAVYYRPEVMDAAMGFLKTYFEPTSFDGTPTVIRNPNADVKSPEVSVVPEGPQSVSIGKRSKAVTARDD